MQIIFSLFLLCFCLVCAQIDLNCLLRQRGGTNISQIQAKKHDTDSYLRLMSSSARIFPSLEPVRLCRRGTWTAPAPVFNHHFCCAVRTRCCSDCPAGTPASTPVLCGPTHLSLKSPHPNFHIMFSVFMSPLAHCSH